MFSGCCHQYRSVFYFSIYPRTSIICSTLEWPVTMKKLHKGYRAFSTLCVLLLQEICEWNDASWQPRLNFKSIAVCRDFWRREPKKGRIHIKCCIAQLLIISLFRCFWVFRLVMWWWYMRALPPDPLWLQICVIFNRGLLPFRQQGRSDVDVNIRKTLLLLHYQVAGVGNYPRFLECIEYSYGDWRAGTRLLLSIISSKY